jgi:flavin reductase (DIM6/NTAB) family NADH-FMN oxidoreductase RutF
MYLNKEDILKAERIFRLNLINSITGVKPANLIGTQSKEGNSNLAIFSSVVHMGSNPALVGFFLRPNYEVRRHTYENILATGYYTINQVPESLITNAHYTSAKFEKEVSEFKVCNFNEEFAHGFPAPFVRESQVKIGMKLVESIPVELNKTMLIIGSVEHIIVPDEAIDSEGHINLQRTASVGISGLNTYYSLRKEEKLPYARVEEIPQLKSIPDA